MFLPSGISLQDFYMALQAVASTVIEAAARKKPVLPDKNNPPRGVNPDAKKAYWNAFCDKYQGTWERYKNEPERAWAACVAIWTNYCLKRKVQPFNPAATQVNEETQDKLIERAIKARIAQLKLAESLVTRGITQGVFSKMLKETFVSITEKKPGVYTILSKRYVNLANGVKWDDPQFKAFMAKSSFERTRGKYVRNVRANTDVIVMMDTEADRPAIYFQNSFTKAYAEIILDIPNEKGNSEKLKTQLTRSWKKVIKNIPDSSAIEDINGE